MEGTVPKRNPEGDHSPALPLLPARPPRRAKRNALAAPGLGRAERFGDYFTWPAASLFGLIYLVGISNGHVMTVVLLGLLAWSVTGVSQAVMAMSLVAMFKFSNGVVASFSPLGTVLFWLITMVASARLYRSARDMSLPVGLLLAFSLVAILLSAVVSKAPDVSVMKVVSFFIVSSAVLVATRSIQASDVAWLQRWFFSIALTMAILSLLTVPFAGIGFAMVPGSLQGMFNHPQAAGIFYVPFASWFIARIFLEPVRLLPRWLLAAAAVFAGLIVASGARTAMFATFLSVGLTLLIWLIRGRTSATTRSRGQIMGFMCLMGVLSLGLLVSGVLNEQLQSVVLKGDDTQDVGEAFAASRGGGMAEQIDNFLAAPMTGHGFGVYREGVRGGEAGVKRVFGIPISAPAEKGVVFTSVLEETGIVGGLLFYALLITIVAAVAQGSSPGATAMVIGSIAVNFGEAIIFSTGGMGLFMWLIIGFGLARAHTEPSASATSRKAGSRLRGFRASSRNRIMK